MSHLILDSNFFIQAHRMYYPLDIATSFWNKVKSLAEQNKILSIDKVRDELFENEDELTKWVKNNLGEKFFISTKTPEILSEYQKIVAWTKRKEDFYLPKAIEEFLEFKKADAWLIAYSLSVNPHGIIVTHEKSSPAKTSKIKIPDVCNDFLVQTISTIEMFRHLGETF